MYMIIYLDVWFFKEILFNSIILFLTGKITNQKVEKSKLIMSSSFGAIYSIILITQNYTRSQNPFFCLICALIMNLIVL